MAVARCDIHQPKMSQKLDYIRVAEVAGDQQHGIRCAVKGCQEPARIWSKHLEAFEYRDGKRVFRLQPPLKVTLQDGGRFLSEMPNEGRLANTSEYRIWLSNSRTMPVWPGVKILQCSWIAADQLEVTVEGDGADLDQLVASRHDIFCSAERVKP